MKKIYSKPVADIIIAEFTLLNTDGSGLKNAREATANENTTFEEEIQIQGNRTNLWED